jgi:hypothetical protein
MTNIKVAYSWIHVSSIYYTYGLFARIICFSVLKLRMIYSHNMYESIRPDYVAMLREYVVGNTTGL